MSDKVSSAHLKLVREQGAPHYDGYNPIAPRSHRWMMDCRKDEESRVFGWALWRCNDRDPDGRTGPPKSSRTAIAHDSRVGKREHLTIKHLAEDLGMSQANATDALRKCVEKELIGTDEKGRMWPRGDAPEPRRIRGEDDGEGDETEEPVFFCTEKSPEAIRLCFQSLDKNRRGQYMRRYRGMPEPLARHFESLDDEARGWHTWHYLEAVEYKEQLEADAIAAARAAGRSLVDSVCAEAGYFDDETRGRKEVSRPLLIDLTIRVQPEEFSVQKNNGHSVQRPNPNLYKGQNGAVQKSASLLGFQRSQSSQSEVESETAEKPVLEASTPPTAPPKTLSKEGLDLEADRLDDQNSVIESVQRYFGRKLAETDKLRADFLELAAHFGIPEASVCRWIGEKTDDKAKARYKIFNPGALHQFALKDLPDWIQQRSREIDSDRNWERNQHATWNEDIRAMAVKKGMQ